MEFLTAYRMNSLLSERTRSVRQEVLTQPLSADFLLSYMTGRETRLRVFPKNYDETQFSTEVQVYLQQDTAASLHPAWTPHLLHCSCRRAPSCSCNARVSIRSTLGGAQTQREQLCCVFWETLTIINVGKAQVQAAGAAFDCDQVINILWFRLLKYLQSTFQHITSFCS